jgi:hypothetical protein
MVARYLGFNICISSRGLSESESCREQAVRIQQLFAKVRKIRARTIGCGRLGKPARMALSCRDMVDRERRLRLLRTGLYKR